MKTKNLIQNYFVTFTHNFDHKYSRFTNSFKILAADVTKEKALEVANVLFPDCTDIEIVSVENDDQFPLPYVI